MAAIPQVTSPTIAAIEAAVVRDSKREDDVVIRASSIGHQCERHLWYRFRWAHAPQSFDGRMLRLFETGHLEETRMILWLHLAGVSVEALDPATSDQWEVEALGGHFKGHLDGIAEGVVEAPVTPHLLECKTHNAKSFAQLKQHGVSVAKPEHVSQMQVYMHLKGLTRALYIAKNKDNDELYVERIRYDANAALALLAKAERIKNASQPLPRISDDPDHYLCKAFNCASYGVCHGGERVRVNCRTCLHSTPIDGGWRCEKFDTLLSLEDQKSGCAAHLYIPALVPGEQIDADDQGRWVTYRMRDGSEWVDGAKPTRGRE